MDCSVNENKVDISGRTRSVCTYKVLNQPTGATQGGVTYAYTYDKATTC
jgi:hypothetical protein